MGDSNIRGEGRLTKIVQGKNSAKFFREVGEIAEVLMEMEKLPREGRFIPFPPPSN